jgi:hypothetical protein
LFIGFIAINYFVRKKIASNIKISNRFLITSWVVIAISAIGLLGVISSNQMNQSYYEKNVAPKREQCYQEYLAGNRTTPYKNCVNPEE